MLIQCEILPRSVISDCIISICQNIVKTIQMTVTFWLITRTQKWNSFAAFLNIRDAYHAINYNLIQIVMARAAKVIFLYDIPYRISQFWMLYKIVYIRTATRENVPFDMCAQRRFRLACAFAQLIRIFTGRFLDRQECRVSTCGQWRI